jgi:hypothetical protein
LKKDYFYWITFFVLFILFYKLLELLWVNIKVFNNITVFTSRLIIIVIGFVISLLLTDKITKAIRKK